ncbi:MAG: hypothetical protein ACRC8A_20100 [Microcoleaceae cyanobacterium]
MSFSENLAEVRVRGLTLEQYQFEVNQAISCSEEQWFFEETPNDLLDTTTLTDIFLESGGCAWYNPVFEREIFDVFHEWFKKHKYLKVVIYSRALLSVLPDDSWSALKDKLADYAQGEWMNHGEANRCIWPALPEEYLKHWNWPMFEFATKFWEERKGLKKAKFDLIKQHHSGRFI